MVTPVGVLGLLPLPLPLPLPRLPELPTELLSMDKRGSSLADVFAEEETEDKTTDCISGVYLSNNINQSYVVGMYI